MTEQALWDRAAIAVMAAGHSVHVAVARANELIEARRARTEIPFQFPTSIVDGAPLGALQLSDKTLRCLHAAGLMSVGDVTNLTMSQVRGLPGIGHLGPNEVVSKLADMGLNLTVGVSA